MAAAAPAPSSHLAELQALLLHASAPAQALASRHGYQQRYLTAHRDSPKAALAGLEATAAWRATAIQPSYTCSMCAAKPGSHCFVSLGRDSSGAALIYGCPSRASEGGEVDRTMAHCANSLEKQWEGEGEAGSGISGSWVWVVDFRDFGFTHALQARLGIALATTFRDHFPERLKAIVLLNPPLLFKGLVAAIGAVADARTLAKLKVLEAPGPQQLCQRLRAEHGVENAEVLEWLQRVLTEPSVPGTLPPLPQHLLHLQV
jgi:hypothetical protein